jgi:hypothetical protein
VVNLFVYFRNFIKDNSVEKLHEAVNPSKASAPDENDSRLYRPIKTAKDHGIPQENLNNIEHRAKDWGMCFKFVCFGMISVFCQLT